MLTAESKNSLLQFYKQSIENRDNNAPFVDVCNELFGFNGSNIPLDRYDRLFQKYQTSMGKSNNMIEAFDVWLTKRLPQQIMNIQIEDEDLIIFFDNVRIYKPYMVAPSDGKTYEGLPNKNNIIPMYPRDALIRQETYSAEVKIDIYAKSKTGSGDFSKQLKKADVIMGKIPIIKGCKYCWLRDMTDEEKTAVGECFNDPMGYFIVSGMEKVIISMEKVRNGQMLVSPWDKKKIFNGIRMTSLTTNNTIMINLNVDHKNDNLIEVTFHNKPPIPVLILSLFLHYLTDDVLVSKSQDYSSMMSSCKSILERIIIPEILEFALSTERTQVKSQLLSTITHSLSLIEREITSSSEKDIDPITILTKLLDRVKNIKSQFTTFIDEIKMNVFPITSSETEELILDNISSEEDFTRRRRMLSKMIATYARHLAGLRPKDDWDSYMVKRVDTSARQMETQFNCIFRKLLKDFKINSLSFKDDVFTNDFKKKLRRGVINGNKKLTNIAEPIQRITPAAIYSQLQRVSIKSDPNSKSEGIRTIHPTQIGYICSGETPEGENCGVLKNLTAVCWVSIARDTEILEDIMDKYVVSDKKDENYVCILLNGEIYGWINMDDYTSLKNDIKTDIQTFDVSVAFSHVDNQVDISSTGSIFTRPMLVVDPETRTLALDKLSDEDLENVSIEDLIVGGFIEFNSPMEVDSRYKEPDSGELWQSLNKGYTYIKIAEFPKNILNLKTAHAAGERLDEQPYTHAELVPYFQFGYSATCVPKANLNKGPRVTYQCSMFKQALSGYHSVHSDRFDSGFKVQQFPSRTLCETVTHDPIGLNAMPTTSSPILAIICKPSNNEDAIVAKREFLDNNLRFVAYTTYTITLRDNDHVTVRPENEDNPVLQAIYKPSDNVSPELLGYPKLYSYVKKGDAILGKYTSKMDPLTGQTNYTQAHDTICLGKEGYIYGVEVVRVEDGSKVVRIKTAQYRRQIVGDKVASRYSQKGTYGEIVSEKDLPRIVGGVNDGVVPDMIFNSHSIPSRLTQAKILETHVTKACVYTGQRANFSPFGEYGNDDYMKEFEKILKDNGIDPTGEETLRHPDGTLLEAKIYVGICAYQVLRHHVADKFQVRDTGKMDPKTHQPVRGRLKEGGLRVGEMERDALLSHGGAEVVQDRMMVSSNLYRLIVCKKCGNVAQSNFEPTGTNCLFCPDSNDFVVITIPHTNHVLLRFLNGAGIHMHYKF